MLQTKGETATETKPYTGEENQEWVFDGVAMRSVEHPHKVLTLSNSKNSFSLGKFENDGKQRFVLTENFLIPEECQNSYFCSSWRIVITLQYRVN